MMKRRRRQLLIQFPPIKCWVDYDTGETLETVILRGVFLDTPYPGVSEVNLLRVIAEVPTDELERRLTQLDFEEAE